MILLDALDNNIGFQFIVHFKLRKITGERNNDNNIKICDKKFNLCYKK